MRCLPVNQTPSLARVAGDQCAPTQHNTGINTAHSSEHTPLLVQREAATAEAPPPRNPASAQVSQVSITYTVQERSSDSSSSKPVVQQPEAINSFEIQGMMAETLLTVSLFSDEQQKTILARRTDPEIVSLITAATECVQVCDYKGITLKQSRLTPPKPVLFAMVDLYKLSPVNNKSKRVPEDDIRTVTMFFKKAALFYKHTGPEIKCTGCLTGMLHTNYWGSDEQHITRFIEQSDDWLCTLAAHPLLRSLSSMCNSRGIPSEADVTAFFSPCLRVGWAPGISSDQLESALFDEKLVTHISSMCNGRGIPKSQVVENFVCMPCLREGWRPGTHDYPDTAAKVNHRLMRRISSMHNGSVIPGREAVENFLNAPCLREGWQPWVKKDNLEGAPLKYPMVDAIASIQYQRGIPAGDTMEMFLSLPCLRDGWQPVKEDSDTERAPINTKRLKSLCARFRGHGFPSESFAENYITGKFCRDFTLIILPTQQTSDSGKTPRAS